MMIKPLALGLLLITALMYASMPVYAVESIKIETDFIGKGSVYIRKSGESKYKKYDLILPCTLKISSPGNYDFMIQKYEDFFWIRKGEAYTISTSRIFPVKINTSKSIAIYRLLIILLIPLVLSAEYIIRKTNQEKSTLQKTIKEMKQNIEEQTGKVHSPMPSQIKGYKITRKIGDGGMAAVYLGEDEDGGRYAIKVPYQRFSEDPIFRKRFEHEAIIGSKLIHPGIVRIFDHNTDPLQGVIFLCMEFIEGETLSNILKKRTFGSASIRSYIKPIVQAIEYAHKNRVIHRDIKPANIILTKNGKPKLMDFGVAKISDLSVLTVTDTMLGTPIYTAPEQIDCKTVDERSDLYSIGIIMYEMLTGTTPFADPDPIKVIMNKNIHEPLPPSAHKKGIEPKLEAIIIKLIKRNPDERYSTSTELIEALNEN